MSKREDNSERKRRPDAWEIKAGLSDEMQRQLFGWARSLGYGRARELIRKEFAVEPPSATAFEGWYEYYSQIESAERVHQALRDSAAIGEMAKACGDISEAMVSALENEACAALLAKDHDRTKLLVGLALKARASRFDEAKYRDAMKSDIERALDALAKQAEGNAEALKYYGMFREAVLSSVERAA
jgi:hypothetical protein